MSLESGSFIKNLVATNPEGTDPKSQGDDHLRLIKAVLLSQFSGFTQGKPITRTEDQINSMLLKGAFGLGGQAMAFTDANAAGGTFESGFYFFSGAPNTGNTPFGSTAGDTMLQIVVNSDLITQSYQSIVDPGLCHCRKWQGGAWSSWIQQWNHNKLPQQTNPLDVNPNTFNRPISFGLGQVLVAAQNSNVDVQWGAFNAQWVCNTWVNKPGGPAATNGLLRWTCGTSDGAYGVQEFHDTNNSRHYRRYKLDNAWGPWAEIMGDQNAQVGGNPNCISLGPINLHWGTTGAIADEGTIAVPFARQNSSNPTVICQVAGPGITSTTFQDLYVSRSDTAGFDLTYRTNGSNVMPNAFWIAIALK